MGTELHEKTLFLTFSAAPFVKTGGKVVFLVDGGTKERHGSSSSFESPPFVWRAPFTSVSDDGCFGPKQIKVEIMRQHRPVPALTFIQFKLDSICIDG